MKPQTFAIHTPDCITGTWEPLASNFTFHELIDYLHANKLVIYHVMDPEPWGDYERIICLCVPELPR